jgi:hypothetical protein
LLLIGVAASLEWAAKAGLRNARAKGKPLGKATCSRGCCRVAALRAHGRSWREITLEMAISKGSARRALWGLPKNVLDSDHDDYKIVVEMLQKQVAMELAQQDAGDKKHCYDRKRPPR